MRVGNKGGVATPCDPYEAKNAQKTAGSVEESEEVLETLVMREESHRRTRTKKGIDSPTANAHQVGDSHTADAEPNSWASVALTHCLTH